MSNRQNSAAKALRIGLATASAYYVAQWLGGRFGLETSTVDDVVFRLIPAVVFILVLEWWGRKMEPAHLRFTWWIPVVFVWLALWSALDDWAGLRVTHEWMPDHVMPFYAATSSSGPSWPWSPPSGP